MKFYDLMLDDMINVKTCNMIYDLICDTGCPKTLCRDFLGNPSKKNKVIENSIKVGGWSRNRPDFP